MVRLFCSLEFASPPDHVPVPLSTMFVVPVTLQFAAANVRLPPTKIVNPFIAVVMFGDPMVRVPASVIFEESVMALVPDRMTLFQLMPLVFSVVEAMTFRVDPVVTTVPAM